MTLSMANRDLQLGDQKVTLNYLILFVSQYGIKSHYFSATPRLFRGSFVCVRLSAPFAKLTRLACGTEATKLKLFRSHFFLVKSLQHIEKCTVDR